MTVFKIYYVYYQYIVVNGNHKVFFIEQLAQTLQVFQTYRVYLKYQKPIVYILSSFISYNQVVKIKSVKFILNFVITTLV